MFRYDAEPGVRSASPATWPAAAAIERERHTWNLVLFAHPHCGCTRATISELDRLLARCPQRPHVRVLFYTDPALEPGWEHTATWERASAIPGVQVVADPLGATARRFGATTSGTVVLYAPDGALRFHGGITAARGHEGDSAGAAGILALVSGQQTGVISTEVFGCSLIKEEEAR
jgi:hypothetical protein